MYYPENSNSAGTECLFAYRIGPTKSLPLMPLVNYQIKPPATVILLAPAMLPAPAALPAPALAILLDLAMPLAVAGPSGVSGPGNIPHSCDTSSPSPGWPLTCTIIPL